MHASFVNWPVVEMGAGGKHCGEQCQLGSYFPLTQSDYSVWHSHRDSARWHHD